MQTFLPYADLSSIKLLDPKRLGNQVYREGKTLISGKWPNHPASKIWKNHKRALALYCLYGLEELSARGRHYPHWYDYFQEVYETEPITGLPPIIGYEPFHSGHRAALLAKDPVWYSKYGWVELPTTDAYVWVRGPVGARPRRITRNDY